MVPAIVVDEPVGVERLAGAAAGAALLACSRLIVMQTPDHPRSMLHLATTLATRIAVYRVTMRRRAEPTLPEPIQTVFDEHVRRGR